VSREFTEEWAVDAFVSCLRQYGHVVLDSVHGYAFAVGRGYGIKRLESRSAHLPIDAPGGRA
jgi:hypothetical protein